MDWKKLFLVLLLLLLVDEMGLKFLIFNDELLVIG
jgi:hypothetical protein